MVIFYSYVSLPEGIYIKVKKSSLPWFAHTSTWQDLVNPSSDADTTTVWITSLVKLWFPRAKTRCWFTFLPASHCSSVCPPFINCPLYIYINTIYIIIYIYISSYIVLVRVYATQSSLKTSIHTPGKEWKNSPATTVWTSLPLSFKWLNNYILLTKVGQLYTFSFNHLRDYIPNCVPNWFVKQQGAVKSTGLSSCVLVRGQFTGIPYSTAFISSSDGQGHTRCLIWTGWLDGVTRSNLLGAITIHWKSVLK